MTLLEYEIFLRERTLSWVRKEIRKFKRSEYLEREDMAFCKAQLEEKQGMVRRLEREIRKLTDDMGELK